MIIGSNLYHRLNDREIEKQTLEQEDKALGGERNFPNLHFWQNLQRRCRESACFVQRFIQMKYGSQFLHWLPCITHAWYILIYFVAITPLSLELVLFQKRLTVWIHLNYHPKNRLGKTEIFRKFSPITKRKCTVIWIKNVEMRNFPQSKKQKCGKQWGNYRILQIFPHWQAYIQRWIGEKQKYSGNFPQ